MRRLIGALALAVSLLLAGAAVGEDWVLVGESDDEAVYLDRSSIERQGDYVFAYTKAVFARPVPEKTVGGAYSTMLSWLVVDCPKHVAALESYGYYDASGKLLRRFDVPRAKWEFEAVTPDSFGDLMAKAVCGDARSSAPGTKRDEARASSAAPAPAPAELSLSPSEGTWVEVGTDPVDGAKASYRTDSIRAAGEDAVALISKREHPRDSEETGVRHRIDIGLFVIDCVTGRYGVLDSALLDADGREVGASHIEAADMVSYAIPSGSVVGKFRDLACASRQAAAPAIPEPAQTSLSSGTGWMTTKGYLITASHVVAGAERIALYQNGRPVGVAEVVADDPANDVAILKPILKGAAHVAIPLSARPVKLGAPVFTIGYPAPDVMGLSVKMTSGEISSLAGLDVANERADDVRLMQMSIPVQSGSSGGPVIDAAGQAVGIVVSSLERLSREQLAQNVNYALKAAYVRNLVAELPDIGGYRLIKPVGTRAELVGSLQDAVFMLIVESRPAAGH